MCAVPLIHATCSECLFRFTSVGAAAKELLQLLTTLISIKLETLAWYRCGDAVNGYATGSNPDSYP